MNLNDIYVKSGLRKSISKAQKIQSKLGDYSDEFQDSRAVVAKAIKTAENMCMENNISHEAYWRFIDEILTGDELHDIYYPAMNIAI